MDFGDLTSYKNIDEYFKVLCAESRHEILQELFSDKKKIAEQKGTLEKDISDAFYFLINTFSQIPSESHIAGRLCKLFQIDTIELEKRQKGQRQAYLRQCIEKNVQKQLSLSEKSQPGDNHKYTTYEVAKHDRDQNNKFGWIDLQTKYKYLKDTFQEILLEKVREFDTQLEQMLGEARNNKKNGSPSRRQKSVMDELSLKNTESTLEVRTQRSHSQVRVRYCQTVATARPNPQEPRFNFANVAIRDTSNFMMKKWGRQEQAEFKDKKLKFRQTFHKTSNIPVIFQFVKKYTKTTKARDHLMKRWHDKQDLTDDELRYLCATSVFLNKTITNSEKQNIKSKINMLNGDMLSRLEVNIAQKIIETYRIFTSKVSDMRSQYYLKMTNQTKEEQRRNTNEQTISNNKARKYQQYLVLKKRFQNLCNSPSFRYRLNHRIMRWVNHFIKKLKDKIHKKTKNVLKKTKRVLSSSVLMRMKQNHPSSRIIKPPVQDEHSEPKTHRTNMSITKQFNSVKCQDRKAYIKHLSNGPKKIATSVVHVDMFSKKVKCDQTALNLIIYVQACWRRCLVMKKFKARLERFREKRKADFQKQLAKLKYLYPPNRRIVLEYAMKRQKQVDRHVLNIFRPFTRLHKKPTSKYTHFYLKGGLTEKQLEMRYLGQTMNKLASKVRILIDCATRNEFQRLMNSGFILTSKEINAVVGGTTALHLTVGNRNIEFTKLLLKGGAEPNCKGRFGNNPLHIAFMNKDSAMIFVLLDYGADLNLTNNDGYTPLFFGSHELLHSLGLQNGFVSGKNPTIDNNQLYYRKVDMIEDDQL